MLAALPQMRRHVKIGMAECSTGTMKSTVAMRTVPWKRMEIQTLLSSMMNEFNLFALSSIDVSAAMAVRRGRSGFGWSAFRCHSTP